MVSRIHANTIKLHNITWTLVAIKCDTTEFRVPWVCLLYRALHWVPIPMSMPMGFWVRMGAILLVMLRRLPMWVDQEMVAILVFCVEPIV